MVPMKVLAAAIGQVLGSPLHPTHASISGGAWTPALWFLASEQGAWYDPSDMSTLFQDAAGTTPVTAVEQPVGLVMDKRLGLVEQADSVLHPLTGAASGAWSHSVDTLLRNGSSFGQIMVTTGAVLDATKKYWLQFTVAGFSGDSFTMHVGGSNIGAISANGSYRFLVSGVGGTALTIIPWGGSAGQATISAISIKELPGNHASQVTGASRPVLSARKNLLSATDAAIYNIVRADTSQEVVTNPFGAGTITKMVVNTNGYAYSTFDGVSTRNRTVSCHFKAGTCIVIGVATDGESGGDVANFDLSSGTILSVGSNNSSATIEAVGDGFYRCSVTRKDIAATNVYFGPMGGISGQDFYMFGAQIEDSPTATAYQRVNTDTNYDTVGFPHFIRFDGVDDFLVTGNIDFTATHEMTVVAGVQSPKTSQGMLLELGSSYDSTFPSFVNFVPNTADGKIFAAYHDAAGYGSYSTAAGVAINANVIAYSFDTAATTVSGKYPRFHLNGVNGMPSDGASEAAGAVFINAPLYIGRRGGTSTPFLGKLYQLVVRGAATADFAPGESFTADKAGVTL